MTNVLEDTEYNRRRCKKDGCEGVGMYLGWEKDRIINEITYEAFQCQACGNISYKVPKPKKELTEK